MGNLDLEAIAGSIESAIMILGDAADSDIRAENMIEDLEEKLSEIRDAIKESIPKE